MARRALSLGACLWLLALALLVAATTARANASSNAPATPGLTAVQPGPAGYFEYALAPGAVTSGAVLVHDLAASAARYLVYVTGADTSPVSGVAYGQPEAHPHGTAAWVRLAVRSVQVPARASVAVRFTVAVPPGTRPGDYVASVAAQPPNPTATAPVSSTKRGVRLLTTTRVIVAVVIHVPGPRVPAARFRAPSVTLQQHRRQVLTIPIDDTGNVLMKPYLGGSLRHCAGGRPELRLPRQLDTFVPHTSIDYPWYLNDQVLSAGCYHITLTLDLRAGGPRLATYSGTLQVGPSATRIRRPAAAQPIHPVRSGSPAWLIAALAAAALLLLLTTLLLLRGHRERRRLLKALADRATPPTSDRR